MITAYGVGAILFVLFNYGSYAEKMASGPAMVHALLSAVGIVVSGIIILNFYNGKKSEKTPKFSKWFFYIFYPAHLLILSIVRIMVQ